MAFFFEKKILALIKGELWERAKKRYVDKGGSPGDDIQAIREWVSAWLSEERKKLKLATSEFKSIVAEKTYQALVDVIEASTIDWYSTEVADIIKLPAIIAVPYEVLRFKTFVQVRNLLEEKIQFKDMLPETLQALAEHAAKKYFKSTVHKARKDYKSFRIQGVPKSFIITDHLADDFYYIEGKDEAIRIDTVILSALKYSVTSDKNKSVQKKAYKDWQKRKKNPDGRPDERVFRFQAWNLNERMLQFLREGATGDIAYVGMA